MVNLLVSLVLVNLFKVYFVRIGFFINIIVLTVLCGNIEYI